MRSSIYDALAPGARALAHARAARLLERDHVDAERIALHLLRSEPASSPHVVELLRAAAHAAGGRGAPDAAATYLRRALEEPAGPETRAIEALVELGRLDEADGVAAAAMMREPPEGHLHTLLLLQARGALRCAQGRYGEALQDLHAVATGWERLGVRHPDLASWRTPAVAACAALDRPEEAARLAVEQLELARRVGTPRKVGAALRVRAGTVSTGRAGELLAEAVALLERTPARVELAHALPTRVRCCAGPGGGARRVDRSCGRWSWPSVRVRRRWPSARGSSSSPPAPDPAERP